MNKSTTTKFLGSVSSVYTEPLSEFSLYDFLRETRRSSLGFMDGIAKVEALVLKHVGAIEKEIVDGQLFYHVKVGSETATCFQPYPDIDRFYFEM